MEAFGEYRIDETAENMVRKYCLQPWQKKIQIWGSRLCQTKLSSQAGKELIVNLSFLNITQNSFYKFGKKNLKPQDNHMVLISRSNDNNLDLQDWV